MATHPKFKPPVFMHGRAAHKNTDHSNASGWLDGIVNALARGTPAALKRLSIAYHGVGPKMQDDLSAPIFARPAAIPADPQDVPNIDPPQTRRVDPTSYPIAHGHHKPHKSGTVPTKLG
jgi:hypothetical protein